MINYFHVFHALRRAAEADDGGTRGERASHEFRRALAAATAGQRRRLECEAGIEAAYRRQAGRWDDPDLF